MRRGLWVPGDFPGTNRLLDLQRASGYYAGVARATRSRAREAFGFRLENGRIREAVALHARAARLAPVSGPAVLCFGLVPTKRTHDPSAWYLAAKAAEDGLVDAGVLGSDRHDVLATAGRCLRDPEELREPFNYCGLPWPRGCPGLFIEIRDGEKVASARWF